MDVKYLISNNVIPRFYIRGNSRCPSGIGEIHDPNISPKPVFVDRLFCDLEELKLVDVYIRNASLVWSHPRGDWAFVTVKPS
jgi:hypothetical protein